MGSELPYMRLWVDDLLADLTELGLTDEEFGVYMRFLLVAWKRGAIPADAKERSRYVTASTKRLQTLWPAFAEKWTSNGNGGLVNSRQERERAEALLKSKKAKAAAEARWGK